MAVSLLESGEQPYVKAINRNSAFFALFSTVLLSSSSSSFMSIFQHTRCSAPAEICSDIPTRNINNKININD